MFMILISHVLNIKIILIIQLIIPKKSNIDRWLIDKKMMEAIFLQNFHCIFINFKLIVRSLCLILLIKIYGIAMMTQGLSLVLLNKHFKNI